MSHQLPTAASPSQPNRPDLRDTAERLAAEGRTHDAIAAYQQMLAHNPQDTDVIGRLADLFSDLAANIRKTLGEDGST